MSNAPDELFVDGLGYVSRGERVAAWPGRRFVVLEYWVLHGQLVLRSGPDGGVPIVDCYFHGVNSMKLSASMTDMDIFAGVPATELFRGEYVYLLQAREMAGWIVSSKMQIRDVADIADSQIQRL